MSGLARIEAWGADAPDWIIALAEECERTSQRATAERIGYSPATVSLVLTARYTGDLTAVEQAVRGALMAATVECPVVGELSTDRCLQHQRAPFSAHNPQRIALFRACPTCRHRRTKGGSRHDQ